MPLLDHFHPPLFPQRHWESFLVTWSGTIADVLNKDLPTGYFAEEHANYPDEFEVRVHKAEDSPRLVAAIELLSPANKDRHSHRGMFAAKCAGYLSNGAALIVVDVVTNCQADLHAVILGLLVGRTVNTGLPPDTDLHAVAYRPVMREGNQVVDVWAEPLAVGRGLPTLPLALNADLCLPIDLEAAYTAACNSRRLG